MGRVPDDPPVNFDDVRADYAATLDWHLKLARYEGPLHFGDPSGALVSRHYLQRQARAVLYAAIYRLEPYITSDLLTPELAALYDEAEAADAAVGMPPWDVPREDRELPAVKRQDAASAALFRYIDGWAIAHGLPRWFGNVAWLGTIPAALALGGIAQSRDPVPLILPDYEREIDMYGQPRIPKRPKPKSPFMLISAEPTPGRRMLWIDDLKHPAIETDDGYWEDEGDFAEYDTGTGNIDAAVLRIMPELERRLRRLLESIEAEERQLNDMVPPQRSNTRQFEWAARCLMGETRTGIEASDGTDRSTISKGIAEVETLTGITMPRPKGGRPRKPGTNTKRVK